MSEPAGVTARRPDREDTRRGERRERHRADVVDDRVQRVPPRAPVDDGDRHRERQRCAIVEERRARERADDADRQRALDLGQLERQRLPGADEREHGEQADVVGAVAPDEAGSARADADDADRRDDEREALRELEEGRAVQRPRLRRAPLLGLLDRVGGRQRRHVLAVLDDGAQLRPALRREQQRLGARADDAVAALELAAIHGEVGLVDQLVRVERRPSGSRRRRATRSRGSAPRPSRPRTPARRPRGGSARRSPSPARAASPGAGSRTPRRRSAPARRSGGAPAWKISAMPFSTASPARWP